IELSVVAAFNAAFLSLVELAVVAPFRASFLSLLELAIVATLRAAFLSALAATVTRVSPELAPGHAAFAAYAIVIGAHIAASIPALDARLAIALGAGIVAPVLNAILR
ncbi:MAG: hypothetical protein AAFN91_16640, partial [Pseudomonadota bacterium]